MRKNRKLRVSVGVFAGITAGLVGLFTPTAQATSDQGSARPAARHSHASDCRLVPADVRALCRTVSGQLPYAYAGTGGGLNQMAAGRLLVREIVHGGLTGAEERDALRGAARDYRAHVTNTRAIVLDVDSLAALCEEGEFRVGLTDDDGRPGGKRSVSAAVDCY